MFILIRNVALCWCCRWICSSLQWMQWCQIIALLLRQLLLFQSFLNPTAVHWCLRPFLRQRDPSPVLSESTKYILPPVDAGPIMDHGWVKIKCVTDLNWQYLAISGPGMLGTAKNREQTPLSSRILTPSSRSRYTSVIATTFLIVILYSIISNIAATIKHSQSSACRL